MNKVKILFVLLFCLISTKEMMAQSDSVQYYMEVDTTRSGIRAGQDVPLRYICTVQYDSVLPPRFSIPVEMVKEAIPHRSGHAVVNGELTDIYEFGFEYIVRFQTAGRHDLPLSSVRVNGKEYRTPPMSVWVQPAIANIEDVECSVSIKPKRPKVGERFDVLLICNRQPDSKRPTVTLNGQPMESGGHSYSSVNAEEEFRFIYPARVADGGRYTLSVSELSFGGTPYHIPDTEIEIAGGMYSPKGGNAPSAWVWLIIAGAYMLFVYLTLWLRFRKEADEELVAFVLTHHRLNLNTEWAYTHYGFPLGILMIPFLFICINIYDYIVGDGANSFFPLFWCGALPLLLAYVSYRSQRKKLDFEPITTTLSVEMIQEAIEEVARKNDWIVDHIDNHCFAAHTSRSFPSLSWGEQVFVVFDKGTVWVNSVNDLNKKSVACSFGYTKKNIQLLREAIENKED